MKKAKTIFYVHSLLSISLVFSLFYNHRLIEHNKTHRDIHTSSKSIDKVLIKKSDRKLYLINNNDIIKEYNIDLGFNPTGHKQKEGDGRTPEGKYKISGRNPNSKYHLSLRISYPNSKDKKNAEKLGTNPGGDIMIHGLPNIITAIGFRKKLKKDWTLGCIAVQTNKEIQEIWDLVKDNTNVEIQP